MFNEQGNAHCTFSSAPQMTSKIAIISFEHTFFSTGHCFSIFYAFLHFFSNLNNVMFFNMFWFCLKIICVKNKTTLKPNLAENGKYVQPHILAIGFDLFWRIVKQKIQWNVLCLLCTFIRYFKPLLTTWRGLEFEYNNLKCLKKRM